MKTVQFQTMIGDERFIRLPAGIQLSPGKAEVIVLQSETNGRVESPVGVSERAPSEPQPWPLVQEMARLAQELGIDDLPPDLAVNHDHYLHGLPKQMESHE